MAKIKTGTNSSHHTRPKNINRRAFDKVYWPYIPVISAITLLLGLSINSGNIQAYARHPGGRVLSYATSMSINGLLADTNAARSNSGVGALSLNSKLDAAAQAKADDMASRNYWSHYTPDGNPPWVFVTAQGYSYQKVGENLATGFNDEQSTLNGWMASPPHRENLLDPGFIDVGFGFANNPNYTAAGGGPMTIVVAFYGKPQVLSASTTASTPPPAQSTPAPAASTVQPAPVPTPPEASSETPAPANTSKQLIQPTTNQTTKANLAPSVKASRIQTVINNPRLSSKLTGIFIVSALCLFCFWATRHLRTLKKFLLEGERYAIRHPLTDLGILVIACLLFILSQTAGIIQ